MKHWLFLFILIFAFNPHGVFANNSDSPETLEWVRRTASKIEKTLNDAINTNDWAYLLTKLMQMNEEFESVAFAGLYCHEARSAAEMGRYYCNWLNSFTEGNDLNSVIVRATEARLQARRMANAAAVCLLEQDKDTPSTSFKPSDILQSNSSVIRLDLTDGLASKDFHILAQKLEHAERVLRDTEVLSKGLLGCERVTEAALVCLEHTRNALLSREWQSVSDNIALALAQVEAMKDSAAGCN
ncbi:MAG: hypothetical protein KF734_01290 [Saprospiraceae bacterium]|nr:hypothetical protein [Saprospiraceae bacterium]